MSTRVGILRCLLYYPFYPFWKEFFERLGMETILSQPMTGDLFDRIARRFVGDICLPIETAFIHAETIKNDVDLVFIPRVNRLHRDVYVCPACAGLPYVIPQNMPDLPDVLTFNLSPFLPLDRADFKTLKKLGLAKKAVRDAYGAARELYESFIEEARQEPFLDVAVAKATGQEIGRQPPRSVGGPRVLLLGMPYVIGDSFVNQGVPRMLAAQKCRLLTPLMVAPDLAHREIALEEYWLYWTFGGMSIGAMTRLLHERAVDAVVYCTSFACGVDSLITPIVQSACRRCYDVPFLNLVLDEHAEAAHLEVRIEAFLDCVKPGSLPGTAPT